MSTHVFPLAGGIDPECSICLKPRSQIQREDEEESEIARNREARKREAKERVAKRVERIAATLKTQLNGAGLAIVDERKFSGGYGDYALLIGDELDRAFNAMARNVMQLIELDEEIST